MKTSLLLCVLILLGALSSNATQLSDCGRVIGHEMGLWEFFAAIPSPEQVDRVLKSDLKFVKISLLKLKDGTWVVNHDDEKTVYPTPGNGQIVHLSDMTWQQVEELKKLPGAMIPIYQLHEYIDRDQQKLCWMFSPKVHADQNLVDEILRLKIQDRSVLLTTSYEEVEFLASVPTHLNFTGRNGDQLGDLNVYAPYVGKLWAIEVDPTAKAPEVTKAAHAMGFKAYTDSMRYSWNYEFLETACPKVFAMGSDYSQSNRPIECIRKMGF